MGLFRYSNHFQSLFANLKVVGQESIKTRIKIEISGLCMRVTISAKKYSIFS